MNNLPERLQNVDFSKNREQREILRARLLAKASTQLPKLAKKEKWTMRFKSITHVIIFTAVMAGMALMFSWFILPFTKSPAAQGDTSQGVNQIVTAMLEAKAREAYPTLLSETPTPITPDFLTYTNHEYGIAFDYPPSWSITETLVPQGTQIGERTLNRYNIYSGSFLIELKKGEDWILEIIARKPEKFECGGFATSSLANFVPGENTFKSLEVLNKKALRFRAENGFAYINLGNMGIEPYPVLVVFPRLPGECEQWAGSDEEIFLFQWENYQTPLAIEFVYYSTYFTEDNLKNRTIDTKILEEMDSIVESLRFQSVAETKNTTPQNQSPTPTATPEPLDRTNLESVLRWVSYAITENKPEMIADLIGNNGVGLNDRFASEVGFPGFNNSDIVVSKLQEGLQNTSVTCMGYRADIEARPGKASIFFSDIKLESNYTNITGFILFYQETGWELVSIVPVPADETWSSLYQSLWACP